MKYIRLAFIITILVFLFVDVISDERDYIDQSFSFIDENQIYSSSLDKYTFEIIVGVGKVSEDIEYHFYISNKDTVEILLDFTCYDINNNKIYLSRTPIEPGNSKFDIINTGLCSNDTVYFRLSRLDGTGISTSSHFKIDVTLEEFFKRDSIVEID